MSFGLYFTPSEGFDAATYDAALARLRDAGAGAPPGRQYHVAMEVDGKITVFDVWDSMEAFEAFGQTLLPILSDLGVDPGQPMVSNVHNIVEGS
jgi:hypothetical protein